MESKWGRKERLVEFSKLLLLKLLCISFNAVSCGERKESSLKAGKASRLRRHSSSVLTSAAAAAERWERERF